MPTDFHSEKIGLIRINIDPLSVIGLNIFFSDLVNLFLRFDCIELYLKVISHLVKFNFYFGSIINNCRTTYI